MEESNEGEEQGFSSSSFSSASAFNFAAPAAAAALGAVGACFRPMTSLRSAALEASREAGGGMRGWRLCFVAVDVAANFAKFSLLGSQFSSSRGCHAAAKTAGERAALSNARFGSRAA